MTAAPIVALALALVGPNTYTADPAVEFQTITQAVADSRQRQASPGPVPPAGSGPRPSSYTQTLPVSRLDFGGAA